MSATQQFFSRLLPGMIVQRFDDFLEYDGRVAFDVAGAGGWTLTFGDVENPVREQLDDGAELKLKFSQPAFEAFVEGTLDTAAAVAAGEVRAEGDFALLGALGVLMMPLQRDLGWDVSE